VNLSIRTRNGIVSGGRANGARHWLGVPYAQAERLGLPVTPDAWSGERSATRFGPECPQYFGSFASKSKIDAREVDEHCLVLNVWRPDTEDTTPKPVMVWIHGGAFMAGTGNIYDGAELAAHGDIVVVTINYRLGILGFVNLDEQGPSNLGMRDQIAALEWVRDNIAAFGGDPSRVTLAGESAGAIAISMLMLCAQTMDRSPSAASAGAQERPKPLFHAAILQSGAISLPHSLATSRRIGRRYCAVLGLKSFDVNRIRALDLRTLLIAQAKVHALEPGSVPGAPWFDGDLFPASLNDALAMTTPKMPMLAGFNRDEIRTFEILRGPPILPMTRTANETLIREQLPTSEAERLLAAYSNTKADNRMLATDLTFGMPTLNFAERHSRHSPTWFYRFDYRHPLIGAAHGIDLAFVWKFEGIAGFIMRGGFFTAKRRALAERMRAHWAYFVKYGRPLEDWPDYSPARRTVRLFDIADATVDDPDASRRMAWNGADVSTTAR
jgi:para-nitrobenzyl esterase